ncbi:GNAT family N-acetyltransferase [Chitinimonas sp.]|uniref:GNAT family N-acetyltransferase n=1 Tax=Chitinimonas sp. TaxID=1934313 RepID=UPI0035ADA9AE
MDPAHADSAPRSITIRQATLAEREAVANMAELYLHDLSEFWVLDVDERGRYHYIDTDKYWNLPQHFAYVFLVDERYAGFALVNNDVCQPGNQWWMAQFFVMRRYRRLGVARQAARTIFDAMPGRWEVGQIPSNLPAQAFWRQTIADYTGGHFEQAWRDDEVWRGALQWFDNTGQTSVTP